MYDAILHFVSSLWSILGEMSPWLLFGFLFAGVLSVIFSEALVRRHLGRAGTGSVVKAALLGVPLPLCSCGVIPVGASLKKRGASNGAIVSFLISTPQTGVDSILVTFSLLGTLLAVVRPLAAFVTGLAGGVVSNAVDPEGPPEQPSETNAAPEEKDPRIWPLRALHHGLVVLPRDLAVHLVAGLAVAAIITILVPQDFFAGRLGTGMAGSLAMIMVMMAFGIPIYVCATASVPIAAALAATGVSPGAILVFLMTGPATNAATISTIWKTVGRRSAIVYLVTIAAGAVLFGLALDALTAAEIVPALAAGHSHGFLPIWLKHASAVVLIGVFAWALIGRHVRGRAANGVGIPEGAEMLEFTVTGMTCEHCAATVRRAALAVEGATDAQVDVASGRLVVSGERVDSSSVECSVAEAGYEAHLSTRS